MPAYEYKVVPAPKRGPKAKGIKGNEARFAHALEAVMNEYGAQGWRYIRTDTLPVEERQGLTGKVTVYQNMLVFRRDVVAAVADVDTVLLPAPESEVVPESAPENLPPEEEKDDGIELETIEPMNEMPGASVFFDGTETAKDDSDKT